MTISIANATTLGARLLDAAGIDEPRMEAGSLLAYVLGRDRTFIIAHAEDALTDELMGSFRRFVGRRAQGEPLQYITGRQEFFTLEFDVTPDVLIPRPETEIIVETARELLRDEVRPFIADIGTGSGCIVISLLTELPKARAVATDISPAALRVAQRNAERHGVSDQLTLRESDCFSALEPDGQFSLIASNPPYVSDSERDAMQREVLYEPRAALFAGPDGLAVIRRLLRDAPLFLQPDGYLVFEIGFGQHEAVKNLIDRDVWKLIEIREDLQRIPRTVVLQNRER
jgi:release factor glutamine methyltransferase